MDSSSEKTIRSVTIGMYFSITESYREKKRNITILTFWG